MAREAILGKDRTDLCLEKLEQFGALGLRVKR
jgi:hypothetical protein